MGSLMYRADLHRTQGAMRVRDEILRRGKALDAIEMPLGVPRIGVPYPERRPRAVKRARV